MQKKKIDGEKVKGHHTIYQSKYVIGYFAVLTHSTTKSLTVSKRCWKGGRGKPFVSVMRVYEVGLELSAVQREKDEKAKFLFSPSACRVCVAILGNGGNHATPQHKRMLITFRLASFCRQARVFSLLLAPCLSRLEIFQTLKCLSCWKQN